MVNDAIQRKQNQEKLLKTQSCLVECTFTPKLSARSREVTKHASWLCLFKLNLTEQYQFEPFEQRTQADIEARHLRRQEVSNCCVGCDASRIDNAIVRYGIVRIGRQRYGGTHGSNSKVVKPFVYIIIITNKIFRIPEGTRCQYRHGILNSLVRYNCGCVIESRLYDLSQLSGDVSVRIFRKNADAPHGASSFSYTDHQKNSCSN